MRAEAWQKSLDNTNQDTCPELAKAIKAILNERDNLKDKVYTPGF